MHLQSAEVVHNCGKQASMGWYGAGIGCSMHDMQGIHEHEIDASRTQSYIFCTLQETAQGGKKQHVLSMIEEEPMHAVL